MLVHVDFGVVVQLFCIVQGLTTALYLLLARPRTRANNWLGLLLLGLTLQVVDFFLSRSGVYFRNRWLYFTPLFFSWSFGPLLLAYLRARFAARPLGWLHFVPGAVQAIFYLVISAQSFDTKTWFWLVVHKPFTRYVEHYGAVLSMAVYLVWAGRLVRQQPALSQWWRRGLLGLGGFYAAAALDPLVNRLYLPAGAPTFYLTSVVLPVVAYAMAVLAWRQERAVERHPAVGAEDAPLPVRTPEAVPRKSPVSVDADQLRRVVGALEADGLFRDPDLTLDRLAQHVDLPSNVVSQLLNAGLGQSFYDVVNGYRLEEVKRRLLTPDAQRLTLLALALEAGFNSKTTFNRVFKEKTGSTPKEYQKKYQTTRWDDSVPSPG